MRFLATFAHALSRAVEWGLRHPLGRSQWLAAALWLGMLACGMIALGGQIARTVNTDIEAYDQGAYVRLVQENTAKPWPAATDGIRNPLFPWLVSRFARGTPVEMFETGKRLNVCTGALLAAALGIWAGRRMGWLPAMTFTSLCGLGVILPISTFAGAETLSYGLFFAAWFVALGLLERLTFPRCALIGALLALGYLAKPSVSLFCSSLAVMGLARWWVARRETDASGWRGARLLGGVALALVVAAPLIVPRAVHAWRQFGDPFQNTSARLFWEEDWDACVPRLALLNPRKIHKIPQDERPSAARYLARNGWSGAWERLRHGMLVQCSHLFPIKSQNFSFTEVPSPKHPTRRIFAFRGYVLLLSLMLTIGLAGLALRRCGPAIIPRSAWFQIGFILLLLSVSLGAFGWYAPIASGARFILALYMPVLGSLFCAAEALRRRLTVRWLDNVCAGIWLLTLGVFLAHMGVIAANPYFGSLKGVL